MKASCAAILNYLKRQYPRFVTSAEIVRNCLTVTPSKRLDELHDAGYIEKQPHRGRMMEYRAIP